MQCISSLRQHAQSLSAALLFLVCANAAYGADTYSNIASPPTLTIPLLEIGSATYSTVKIPGLTVGDIVGIDNNGIPEGSKDSYTPSSQRLFIPSVIVDSAASYTNVTVNVGLLPAPNSTQITFASVSGADTYGYNSAYPSHSAVLSIPIVEITTGALAGKTFCNVVVTPDVTRGAYSVSMGMPQFAEDQYNPATGVLNIPAVTLLANNAVYTNVTVTFTIADVLAYSICTIPITNVSAALVNYYVTGFYGTNATNDAVFSDFDVLEDFSIGACTQPNGYPCPYSGTTTTLSSGAAAPTSGTDSGAFNPTGPVAFEDPSTISITSTANGGFTWQGGLSVRDNGQGMVAMQTAATSGSPTPGVLVGVVPEQGKSLASLTGGYIFAGIGTNPTTGVPGGAGVLEQLVFDGAGGFSGTETTNTLNPTAKTGGVQTTVGVKGCPNGITNASGGLICGSYTLAVDGTVTLTYASGAAGGFNAGDTVTGAASGATAVLTNLTATGARMLLVGIAGPTKGCTGNPLLGAGEDSTGVYQVVGLSFNNSQVVQYYFNPASTPYTVSNEGGTLNAGGTLSSLPNNNQTANYSIGSNCLITVAHQTALQGGTIDSALGGVSPDGAVFALADIDPSGAGPSVTVGEQVTNLIVLP